MRLIPFYRGADPAHLEKLRKACDQPERVRVEPYTARLALSPLLSCSHIVTSRYHAALIAACLRIPFACLVPDMHRHYASKMDHLATLIGYGDHFIKASEVAASDGMPARVIAGLRVAVAPQVPVCVIEETAAMLEALWANVADALG